MVSGDRKWIDEDGLLTVRKHTSIEIRKLCRHSMIFVDVLF